MLIKDEIMGFGLLTQINSQKKPLCVIGVLIFLVMLSIAFIHIANSGEKPVPNKVSKLRAVVPLSNDLDPGNIPKGNVIPIPRCVEKKIKSVVNSSYENWHKSCVSTPDIDPTECRIPRKKFFGPIIRIASPNSVELYVFEINYGFGSIYFGFILYDPKTTKCTKNPPLIYGKWMEGDWGAHVEKPIINFTNTIGDNSYKLVVQERVHNGTMYNAVVYHYFSVGSDLSLAPILNLETRLIDLFTEPDNGVIHRNIKRVSPSEILLTAVLVRSNHSSEIIGEATLRQESPYTPFQVASRRVVLEKYKEFIISAFGVEEDNVFLREGYKIYY